ncbi:MAG: PEP_CTERM-anchored TLD domain-containing protein, partial [Rhodospirillaceae bacterium]
HVTQLETWLGEGPLTLTNIYTKSAGDTSFDFHAAVGGMGRTFVLVEILGGTNTSFGGGTPGAYGGGPQIVGGYNPRSWVSAFSYIYTHDPEDMTAFLFNLTQGLFKEQVSQHQTLDASSYGPTFGGGHDLYIDTGLTSGYAHSCTYCDPGTATPASGSHCYITSSSHQFNILGEAYRTENLQIGAIEVFALDVADSGPVAVPEPVMPALLGVGLLGIAMARRKRAGI